MVAESSVMVGNDMKLSLYYPVKPFYFAQHFGDNIPCVKDFGLPTQTIVDGEDNKTCPVGYDKLYQKFGMSGHNGSDLHAEVQNVYAACGGTVIEKQTVPARGLGLGILTDTPVEIAPGVEHYMKIRYWHLKSFFKEVGDHVDAGDLIGISNNTGYSSGNHLHFEGQPMDKDAGGHPFLTYPNNGIGAAVDLEPFFTGEYAEDIPKLISINTQLVVLLQKIINLLKK